MKRAQGSHVCYITTAQQGEREWREAVCHHKPRGESKTLWGGRSSASTRTSGRFKWRPNHAIESEGLLLEEVTYDEHELHTNSPYITSSSSTTSSTTITSPCSDLKPQEVIKHRTFWMLWLIYFFNTIAIGYINAMGKSFGQTYIKDDHFLAVMISMAAIFNAGGRVAWGRLMDITSFRISMRMVTSLLTILFATMPLTVYLGKGGFMIWLWAIFFTFSGTFVLMPTAIEKTFGADHYSANYGLLFTSQTVSGPLIALGNQLLLTTFGFTGCFLVVAFIIFLSLCMTFLIPEGI